MNNLFEQTTLISLSERRTKNGHNSCLILFTGLSGSGKSTLAVCLERRLFDMGIQTYLLDGDNIRLGLNQGLGFSDVDRRENLRRIGEVSKLFIDSGTIVLAAFVAPFEAERKNIKHIVGEENYFEIHVSTPLEECEKRDVKGLYQKARSGEVKDFTGISSPYETPENPFHSINTSQRNLDDCVQELYNELIDKLKKVK